MDSATSPFANFEIIFVVTPPGRVLATVLRDTGRVAVSFGHRPRPYGTYPVQILALALVVEANIQGLWATI